MKPILLVILVFLISACSAAPAADNVATSVAATIAAQQPAQQGQVSSPTMPPPTEAPTNPPLPTNTPKPTNTPRPTSTPMPTRTPTPIPEPVILTGSGDSVVDIDWDGAGLLHITYSGGSNFAIVSYDDRGEYLDLLVNTIGAYEGILPLDFVDDEDTTRFEITASGSWEIQVLPLSNIRVVEIPGTFTGVGDDVVYLSGSSSPDLLVVDASTAESNFVVYAYNGGKDLLVNEIAPYTGTVMINRDAVIVQVLAEGNWSIEVKTR